MTIWINGQFAAKDQAALSVFDHGVLYGDGVFEGIRIYHGGAFRLDAHLRRLFDGAQALMLNPGVDRPTLARLVNEAIIRDGCQEGYIRLLLTRGVGPLGLDPFTCEKPSIVIIVDSIKLYPADFYRDGVPIITSSLRRNPSDSLDARLKSLNYLNNILAKIEARQAGAQEAILLNHQGFVAECTGDNLFAVRDGTIIYPQSYHGALEGITQQVIIELAKRLGIPIAGGTLAQYDLYVADEVFLTGTGAELVPVAKIDGRLIGRGQSWPVFDRLRQAFRDSLADPAFRAG